MKMTIYLVYLLPSSSCNKKNLVLSFRIEI